ncbi:hypothetical protein PIB30_099511, partial [Stylosanthes scabra]|nr:hypothetical protein [Stylosanthes scabra]
VSCAHNHHLHHTTPQPPNHQPHRQSIQFRRHQPPPSTTNHSITFGEPINTTPTSLLHLSPPSSTTAGHHTTAVPRRGHTQPPPFFSLNLFYNRRHPRTTSPLPEPVVHHHLQKPPNSAAIFPLSQLRQPPTEPLSSETHTPPYSAPFPSLFLALPSSRLSVPGKPLLLYTFTVSVTAGVTPVRRP